MQTLSETVLAIVSRRRGISTADLAGAIYGRREQPLINGECLHLENTGRLIRRVGEDGIIGNYLPEQISE